MAILSYSSYTVQKLIDITLDLGLTPHLVVDSFKECPRRLLVPEQYVNEMTGIIVLNLDIYAIDNYEHNKEQGMIYFNARFGGSPFRVVLPVEYIAGVACKEGSHFFPLENKTHPEFIESIHSAEKPKPIEDEKKAKRVNPFKVVPK